MRRVLASVAFLAAMSSTGAWAQPRYGEPLRSQCRRGMRPARVVLDLPDVEMAQPVIDILRAIHGESQEVSCPGMPCIAAFRPERMHDDERARHVGVRSMHDVLRAVYGGERQQDVVELEVIEGDGEPHVRVVAEVEAAVLVVTGDGADTVHDFGRRAGFMASEQTSGEGWAVRALGPQRSQPLEIEVPAGARASLLTCWNPVRLQINRDREELWVYGVPRDDRFRFRALIDLQEAETGEIRRDTYVEIRVPEQLTVGRHAIRAELIDDETDDIVSWVEGHFHVHQRIPLSYTAGLGGECLTLHSGAVANRNTVEGLMRYAGRLRVGVRAVNSDGRYYRGGTEICFWSPWWHLVPFDTEPRLADTAAEVNAIAAIDVQPLPVWLLGGFLLALIIGSLWILVWGLWPQPASHVTRVAWSVARDGGYRDGVRAEWKVVELPEDDALVLAEVDEALSGRTATLRRRDDGRVMLEPGGPMVVAPLGMTPTVQLSETVLTNGAVVIDGELQMVVLDAANAERVDADVPVPLPSRDAVQRAREIGFTAELVVPPAPVRAVRGLWIGVWAIVGTLLSFVPALLGQALPPLRPVTDHVASWVLFSLVLLALQAALVRRARAKDGTFPR